MSVRFNDLEAPLTSARVLSVVIEETTDWNLLTGGELKTDNSREVWLWIRDGEETESGRRRVMGDDRVNFVPFS